jgi:hypothetical protein
VIGIKIECMVKEFLLGLRVRYMKDSIMKIKSMVLGNLRSRMGRIMKVIGCLDNVMGVGFWCRLMGLRRKVSGVRISLFDDCSYIYIIFVW